MYQNHQRTVKEKERRLTECQRELERATRECQRMNRIKSDLLVEQGSLCSFALHFFFCGGGCVLHQRCKPFGENSPFWDQIGSSTRYPMRKGGIDRVNSINTVFSLLFTLKPMSINQMWWVTVKPLANLVGYVSQFAHSICWRRLCNTYRFRAHTQLMTLYEY